MCATNPDYIELFVTYEAMADLDPESFAWNIESAGMDRRGDTHSCRWPLLDEEGYDRVLISKVPDGVGAAALAAAGGATSSGCRRA